MAASFVSHSMADRFPAGTTVGAYPASSWLTSQLPPSGAPPGSATETAVMAADGSLSFAALAFATPYFAAANVGGWRYVRFATPAAAAAGGGVTPLTFSDLTLGTGITSFGTPYAVPGAAVDGLGVVHLRGLIGGSASNAAVVATLPDVGMRPASRRVVLAADANAARATLALIVEPAGTIKNVGTWTNELAHLDGCSFAIQGATS